MQVCVHTGQRVGCECFFVRGRLLRFFVVFVSVRCVLWCVGCLKGAVGWIVCWGARCRFLSDFCLCLVICSGFGFC